eukprot:TRINITY_DN49179_c0_g1_i1.p2 TRINITY_DN49179_c0_g1~~TRINITY_DN49179_c0_g1_i1.p2  ORF type:complete len:182 (+),score=31.61 TRINITY_DN49179_c0_g1_i1:36-548(+)
MANNGSGMRAIRAAVAARLMEESLQEVCQRIQDGNNAARRTERNHVHVQPKTWARTMVDLPEPEAFLKSCEMGDWRPGPVRRTRLATEDGTMQGGDRDVSTHREVELRLAASSTDSLMSAIESDVTDDDDEEVYRDEDFMFPEASAVSRARNPRRALEWSARTSRVEPST